MAHKTYESCYNLEVLNSIFMESLAFLTILGGFTVYVAKPKTEELSETPKKLTNRVARLWEVAHDGMRNNRLLSAEKALLTILNIDKRNAAAYNRLGILYAKQKEYKDAIDCFEVASSIEPSASSLHNLGLIYFETENYEKAATAFERSLKLESDFAARHIAYAKANEKLERYGAMVKSLEQAVELEETQESLSLLLNAYTLVKDEDAARRVKLRLDNFEQPVSPRHRGILPKRVKRPKRIVQ